MKSESTMICNKIDEIKSNIPTQVQLVAVSKTKPIEAIQEAYACGQRDFGENKVQELADKYEQLPKDIHWHMIGHLQRNKVKYLAPFVYLIHGVDNTKLLNEIDKQALKNQRKIDILLQIKIAQEDTKFGMMPEILDEILQQYKQNAFPNVRIRGLMGMATHTKDEKQVRNEFLYLHELFVKYQSEFPNFDYLSMGMSNDYMLAIQAGSNMIRVGSAIFGARNY